MNSASSVYAHIVENYETLPKKELEQCLKRLEEHSISVLLHAANKKYSRAEYLCALRGLSA